MASVLPQLQLHFIQQKKKRVLPMSLENVTTLFKTVLTKEKVGGEFGERLGVPSEHLDNPSSAADWWVKNGKDRRWRLVIYELDELGETEVADQLMPYCEPPSDPSLTIERVRPVFMTMTDWAVLKIDGAHYDVIPNARAENIRSQYPSDDDQRKQAAIYYVNMYPHACWEDLARFLYLFKEVAALEAFKDNLPKIIDPTLTPGSIYSVLPSPEEYMDDWHFDIDCLDEWDEESTSSFDEDWEIPSRDNTSFVFKFIDNHPYPRWEQVVRSLATEYDEHARVAYNKFIRNLDWKPELKDLTLLKSPSGKLRIEIIKTIAPMWKEVGMYLQFNNREDLHRIERQHPSDPLECCIQMMELWLKGKCRRKATWGTLIETLKDAECIELAHELEDVVFPKYEGRGSRPNKYYEQQKNEEKEEEEGVGYDTFSSTDRVESGRKRQNQESIEVECKKRKMNKQSPPLDLPNITCFKTLNSGIINVAERIGTKYTMFGIQLLHDTTGEVTDAIEKECQRDALKVNIKILQKWIGGKGEQPVTWTTLVEVLKKIELGELACEIEENLQHIE